MRSLSLSVDPVALQCWSQMNLAVASIRLTARQLCCIDIASKTFLTRVANALRSDPTSVAKQVL